MLESHFCRWGEEGQGSTPWVLLVPVLVQKRSKKSGTPGLTCADAVVGGEAPMPGPTSGTPIPGQRSYSLETPAADVLRVFPTNASPLPMFFPPLW